MPKLNLEFHDSTQKINAIKIEYFFPLRYSFCHEFVFPCGCVLYSRISKSSHVKRPRKRGRKSSEFVRHWSSSQHIFTIFAIHTNLHFFPNINPYFLKFSRVPNTTEKNNLFWRIRKWFSFLTEKYW